MELSFIINLLIVILILIGSIILFMIRNEIKIKERIEQLSIGSKWVLKNYENCPFPNHIVICEVIDIDKGWVRSRTLDYGMEEVSTAKDFVRYKKLYNGKRI